MARVRLRPSAAGPLGAGFGCCKVELRRFDAEKGRWEVSLGTSAAPAALRPSCLEVVEGGEEVEAVRRREVIVEGEREWKGLCGAFLATADRWRVELEGGVAAQLPSDVLRDAGSGRRVRDPVAVGEWPEREGQKALFATEDVPAGRILFQEDPLLVIPAPEECTWQVACLLGVEAFLELPKDKQAVLLELHAEDVFSVYSIKARTMTMLNRDFRDPETEQHFLSKEEVLVNTGLSEVMESDAQTDDVWRFLCVMQANGMELDSYNALFPLLSHMNHSCEPNASCLDHEDGKVVTAVRDIRQGEQITISYIGESQLLEPPALRQRYLSHWGFVCCCARCSVKEEPLRAFLCPEGCGGTCIPTSEGRLTDCGGCGHPVDAAEAQCMLQMEDAIVDGVLHAERNSRLLGQEPTCLEELLEQAAELLSPLHWVLARLHSLGRDHFRQKLDLPSAEHHAALELRFLRHHMRWPNPHTALVGHARADMLLALGRCAEAFAEYSSSLQELLRVLPASSRLCEAVRRKLWRTLQGPAPEEGERPDNEAGPGASSASVSMEEQAANAGGGSSSSVALPATRSAGCAGQLEEMD